MRIEYVYDYNNEFLAEMGGFLLKCGINWDENSQVTVTLRDEDGTLIATGALQEYILKCICVTPELKGEGLAAIIITELTKIAFSKGNQHLFIFSKPENEDMFRELGFYKVVLTKDVLWMENKKDGIKEFVNKLECPTKEGIIGSIVANCNPFTNGHLYLIETASKSCELVHLFILSEDKSLFSSEVRYEIAKKATKHLKNVVIHKTGKYLVSMMTFPTYFIKEKERVKDINCSLDIKIFAEQFAKPLNITKRFVGNEPNSNVTNEYNNAMKTLLPQYGIQLVELQRIEIDHEPISASKVRRLLEKGELAKVKKLVPDATLEVLNRGKDNE